MVKDVFGRGRRSFSHISESIQQPYMLSVRMWPYQFLNKDLGTLSHSS